MPKKLPVSETAQEDYALIIREIKAQLGRLGWSDAEFARRFGVSQPAMQRRMSCATECTATELIDMCIVLGVSLATIVDDAKRHRPQPVRAGTGAAVAGARFELATSGSRAGYVFGKRNVRPASRAGNGGTGTTCGQTSPTTTARTSKHRAAAPRRSAHGSPTCAAGPGSARTRTRLHV